MSITKDVLLDDALDELIEELDEAQERYPGFASAHEGFAILLEEVDELKQEVWLKPGLRSKDRMRAECIQIAAMAMRFIIDVCDSNEEVIK